MQKVGTSCQSLLQQLGYPNTVMSNDWRRSGWERWPNPLTHCGWDQQFLDVSVWAKCPIQWICHLPILQCISARVPKLYGLAWLSIRSRRGHG